MLFANAKPQKATVNAMLGQRFDVLISSNRPIFENAIAFIYTVFGRLEFRFCLHFFNMTDLFKILSNKVFNLQNLKHHHLCHHLMPIRQTY